SDRHPTSDPTLRQESEEEHQLRCRPSFPEEILFLIEDGEVGHSEALLLMYVDHLVHTRGVGCFASNAYLAKKLNLEVRQIQNIIAKMVKIGLLARVGTINRNGKDFRLMETAWSRIKRFDGVQLVAPELTSVQMQSVTPTPMQFSAHRETRVNTEILERARTAADAAGSAHTRNGTHTKNGTPPRDKVARAQQDKFELGIKPPPDESEPARCARWFKRIVEEVKKTPWNVSLQEAKPHFVRLIAKCKGVVTEVTDVLDWWEKNPDQWRCKTPKTFYDRFADMQDKMKRTTKPLITMPDKSTPVILEPEVVEIVDELKTLGWPKGSLTNLPEATARTYDAMKAMYSKLYRVKKRIAEGDTLQGRTPMEMRELAHYIEEVIAVMGMHAQSAATHWMRSVHKRVANWADWSGDLKSYVFSYSNKQFLSLLADVSRRYDSGNPKWVPFFLESLGVRPG